MPTLKGYAAMNFNRDQMYKLVELKGALVIMDANDKIKGQPYEPLIIGKMPWVLEYILAYSGARSTGMTLPKAHDAALKTAGIPKFAKSELNEKKFILDSRRDASKLGG